MPYLGRILGFEVDVRPWIEVIDHVVPGAVVAALAGWVFHQTSDPRRTRPSRQLAGAGGCILAGIWIFANHLTLLKDAGDGRVAWGAALWHASTSLAIIAASIAYLFAAVEPVESL